MVQVIVPRCFIPLPLVAPLVATAKKQRAQLWEPGSSYDQTKHNVPKQCI